MPLFFDRSTVVHEEDLGWTRQSLEDFNTADEREIRFIHDDMGRRDLLKKFFTVWVRRNYNLSRQTDVGKGIEPARIRLLFVTLITDENGSWSRRQRSRSLPSFLFLLGSRPLLSPLVPQLESLWIHIWSCLDFPSLGQLHSCHGRITPWFFSSADRGLSEQKFLILELAQLQAQQFHHSAAVLLSTASTSTYSRRRFHILV